MPLSKSRMRERKRQDRFDNRKSKQPVKPKYVTVEAKRVEIPELDADGQVIPTYL